MTLETSTSVTLYGGQFKFACHKLIGELDKEKNVIFFLFHENENSSIRKIGL